MKSMKTIRKNNYHLDLQRAAQAKAIPSRRSFLYWIQTTLQQQKIKQAEITLRIVTKKESAYLNATYRHKTGPTNILSFPFAAPPGISSDLLGDLVICASLVAKEAREQDKPVRAHWAHLTIHGVLHLLGYDHIKNKDAEIMEKLEIKLLKKLGFADPYQDR